MSPAYAAPVSSLSPSQTGSLAVAGAMTLNVVCAVLLLPLVPAVGLMWACRRLQAS
jgi:hypothetical protein